MPFNGPCAQMALIGWSATFMLIKLFLRAESSLGRLDRQCTYTCNTEALSRNHCCLGKAISIKYSECMSVALVIQDAKRMRHIILSSATCLVLRYFSALYHKRHDFWEKVIEHKTCVLILCTSFGWNILILRRIKRDIVLNVHMSSCKVPVVLVRFQWNLKCVYRFSINTQISNFVKIRPVGAELFHADCRIDGQTWQS
jgi:hypothetical protein